jgi:hypothetical protein
MVFKKDITPFGGKKGTVAKHTGKGATEQRFRSGASEALTGGDRFGRTMNRYPKPNPEPKPSADSGVESGPTELGLGNAYEFRRRP